MATAMRSIALRASSVPVTASPRLARASLFITRTPQPLRRSRIAQRLASSVVRAAYETETKGEKGTLDYRIFFKSQGNMVSPWHDIPLSVKGEGNLFNFIVEIPKETDAKMEVATDEDLTPIKQDTKKGKLRFYPYNINWNYGLLPQTWEDPGHTDAELDGVAGDNDPVDVVEIGSRTLAMGSVVPVKVLGVFAMIDDGELDWKVIAIAADDPKASSVNDVEDVEREFPGELQKVYEWFRDYKIPDGKPANAFGYDNKCMNKEFALKVISQTNGFYNALKAGETANKGELALA